MKNVACFRNMMFPSSLYSRNIRWQEREAPDSVPPVLQYFFFSSWSTIKTSWLFLWVCFLLTFRTRRHLQFLPNNTEKTIRSIQNGKCTAKIQNSSRTATEVQQRNQIAVRPQGSHKQNKYSNFYQMQILGLQLVQFFKSYHEKIDQTIPCKFS